MSKLTVKRAEKIVELCLDMSLRVEWEQAHEELLRAGGGTKDERLAGGGRSKASARIRELEKQMRASVVEFRLRGLPRGEWSAKVAKHPPRKDNDQDRALGVNSATFWDEVMPLSVVSITDANGPVDFDMATDWVALADEMTDAQYGEFVSALLELNRGSTSVPFSLAASRPNRDSSETSK